MCRRRSSPFPPCLNISGLKPSEPGAFPHLRALIAFFTSGRVGGNASSSSGGITGIEFSASSSVLDGWFKIVSKCSAHLFRIVDGSVSSVEPSALFHWREAIVLWPTDLIQFFL